MVWNRQVKCNQNPDGRTFHPTCDLNENYLNGWLNDSRFQAIEKVSKYMDKMN